MTIILCNPVVQIPYLKNYTYMAIYTISNRGL